jgi:hypothetical protein
VRNFVELSYLRVDYNEILERLGGTNYGDVYWNSGTKALSAKLVNVATEISVRNRHKFSPFTFVIVSGCTTMKSSIEKVLEMGFDVEVWTFSNCTEPKFEIKQEYMKQFSHVTINI